MMVAAAALGICAHWACQSERQGGEVVGLFHGEGTLFFQVERESKSPSQTNLGSWPKSEEKVVLPCTHRI